MALLGWARAQSVSSTGQGQIPKDVSSHGGPIGGLLGCVAAGPFVPCTHLACGSIWADGRAEGLWVLGLLSLLDRHRAGGRKHLPASIVSYDYPQDPVESTQRVRWPRGQDKYEDRDPTPVTHQTPAGLGKSQSLQ